jgi:hypothetical protein
MNFVPSMDEEALLTGYAEVMRDLYNPDAYYSRCQAYVSQAGRIPVGGAAGFEDVKDFLKIVFKVGIQSPRRRYFWRLIFQSLRSSSPHAFRWAVVKALQGEHLIPYTERHVLPRLKSAIEEVVAERQAAEKQAFPQLVAESLDQRAIANSHLTSIHPCLTDEANKSEKYPKIRVTNKQKWV